MTLLEKLKSINNLDINTGIKITFIDGEEMFGKYKGYTAADDNELNVPTMDFLSETGTWYEFNESEINTIQKIQEI